MEYVYVLKYTSWRNPHRRIPILNFLVYNQLIYAET